jgi:hypothetical protein
MRMDERSRESGPQAKGATGERRLRKLGFLAIVAATGVKPEYASISLQPAAYGALLALALIFAPGRSHARWMSPSTGRFWTMDTYEASRTDALSLHKYVYAADNPINLADSTGMQAEEIISSQSMMGTLASTPAHIKTHYNIRLDSITIKREHVDWLALLKMALGKDPGQGGIYGNWWIEFDGQSYGWWPKNKVGLIGTLTGVPGELNGQTSFGGTPTKDPHDGDSGELEFHPYKQSSGQLRYASGTKCNAATQAQVKDCAGHFVRSYSGSWSYPSGQNCHSFQTGMMRACCMTRSAVAALRSPKDEPE